MPDRSPEATLPAIVLVHGAWHTPLNYAPYISALERAGFTVHCPRLPTCSGTPGSPLPPHATFAEDVALVRRLLDSLVVAEGRRVLLVMHSYGGAVGTDAVSSASGAGDLLDFASRKEAGLGGGVLHLLYLCAYILQPGNSVWDIVEEAGFAASWDEFIHTDERDNSVFPRDPALVFCNILPSSDAGPDSEETRRQREKYEKEARLHLVRFPTSALLARVQGEAWKTIPLTYVHTENDYTVSRKYQDIMIGKVRAAGVGLRSATYETHHSIFSSRTEDMVQEALKAARDERNFKG